MIPGSNIRPMDEAILASVGPIREVISGHPPRPRRNRPVVGCSPSDRPKGVG
jgi:hypothetical protein